MPLAGLATDTPASKTGGTIAEDEELRARTKSPRSLTRRVSHGFIKKVWRRKQYLAGKRRAKRAEIEDEEEEEEEERVARQQRRARAFSDGA